MTAGCCGQAWGWRAGPRQSAGCRKRLTCPSTCYSRRCFWKCPSPLTWRGYTRCHWVVHTEIKHVLFLLCLSWSTPLNTLQVHTSLWQVGFLVPVHVSLTLVETLCSPSDMGSTNEHYSLMARLHLLYNINMDSWSALAISDDWSFLKLLALELFLERTNYPQQIVIESYE